MAKPRKTTINADYGHVKVKAGLLVIQAYRGQETVHLILRVADYGLWHIAEQVAELARDRRRNYLASAAQLEQRMAKAVEKVAT